MKWKKDEFSNSQKMNLGNDDLKTKDGRSFNIVTKIVTTEGYIVNIHHKFLSYTKEVGLCLASSLDDIFKDHPYYVVNEDVYD